MAVVSTGTARNTWRIALLPGDGIGVEVSDAAEAVLTVLRERSSLPLAWQRLPWPSTAWHQAHGAMMPDDALTQLREFDTLLLGALGDPGPSRDKQRYQLPDGISLSPLLALRKGFDLWACERPAICYPGATRYLADPRAADVDMLVIRENSEGEYVNQGGRLRQGSTQEIATQLEVFSYHATERVIRHAFERARQRQQSRAAANAPRHYTNAAGDTATAQVCLITKRNAQRYWGELYTDVFAQVASDYPDIGTHHELVDAACMKFVQCPWRFDVVVASNLHGDILTDLAAVLSGGMGVAPSTNINPQDRSVPPLFEPTHGSAPDIAGQDLADPRAMLFSTALMLDWMGEEDAAASTAATMLRDALCADLAANSTSPRGTQQITRDIIQRLSSPRSARD
ncbi:isocitrate/isopropylmalate dehydrogenase family protein [Alcanivorax sp. JB21]|uniref:isocitrate/isopropylmalate dehydrogenase family protein n=1 Tax=Alcanivorax limicola TaxID=2874102 RepID=UPI001CBAEC33|nr:isocitrate/isopropylmalate family dehydrogenase [Alcanivorax limicola]MBZ2189488.1 isocitrate/isopropylmalate dehydrogenase family protein [Alcanivorax limicola]